MSDRKNDAMNKVRVLWEAVRRIPEYRKLYALHQKNDKWPESFLDTFIKFYQKYGIWILEDPSKKSTEIPFLILKRDLQQRGIRNISDSVWQPITSKNHFVKLCFDIDMTRSCERLKDDFFSDIKHIKAIRRKRGLDKLPPQVICGRKRIHCYDIEDFETYDTVSEMRRKNRRLTFYQIAKTRLANKTSNSYVIDMEMKRIKSAYKRAEWLIKGGYRTLM